MSRESRLCNQSWFFTSPHFSADTYWYEQLSSLQISFLKLFYFTTLQSLNFKTGKHKNALNESVYKHCVMRQLRGSYGGPSPVTYSWYVHIQAQYLHCICYCTQQSLLQLVARQYVHNTECNEPCCEGHLILSIIGLLMSNEDTTRCCWDLRWWALCEVPEEIVPLIPGIRVKFLIKRQICGHLTKAIGNGKHNQSKAY